MPPTKEQIKICLSVAVLILQKVENNIRKGMTIKFTSRSISLQYRLESKYINQCNHLIIFRQVEIKYLVSS